MNTTRAIAWCTLGLLAWMGGYPLAWGGEDKTQIVANLKALKVVERNGEVTYQSSKKVGPGDLLEYRAVYRNLGDTGVTNLVPTVPIPVGMEYVSQSAEPPKAMASLDGQSFAVVPLTRAVKLPNGNLVEEKVPFAEYRFVRWSVGTLPAHGSTMVTLRVRVSGGEAASRAEKPLNP